MNGEIKEEKGSPEEATLKKIPADASGGRSEHSEEAAGLQPSDESYDRAE